MSDRRSEKSNKTSRKGLKLDYQLARLGRRAAHALASGVLSFAGRVGVVVPQAGDYSKSDVGLANVDNTSDVNKPVSTAQAAADTAVANAAAAALTAHEGAANPHPTYLTAAEGDAAYAPIAHVGAGGAAHADVVAGGASGFMTGADKTKLNAISGTNTGDQTSIVGITGSLAEFNAALTGADFATGGGTVSGASSGTNTGDQTSIVGITGSLAEFNAALTGADFASGGGTVTGASSGTNTGDQTSIVGITGTKAQFDTAVTDGNFAYQSDLAGYQPLDTELTAIAALASAADKGIQFTGAGTASLIGLAFGTYTPTLFNTTNVAASTAYECNYLRVGDIVFVSGRVDVDVTAGSVATLLGMSLPIASNIANDFNAGGTAVSNVAVSVCAAIRGDPANDRASFSWVHTADTANRSYFFSFMYRII